MLNKVILIGNLGQDPEVRALPSGGSVANISVATSESWTDKNTGQKQERTEWHRVVFFNRLADIVAQYLRKGSKVYIEGSIRTRKWQGQDGQDRYTTEIVANEMQMLDKAPQQQQQAAPQQQYQAPRQQAAPQQQYQAPRQQAPQQQYQAPRQQAAPQQQYQAPQQQYQAPQQQASSASSFSDLDDGGDVPF